VKRQRKNAAHIDEMCAAFAFESGKKESRLRTYQCARLSSSKLASSLAVERLSRPQPTARR
jgi:hypothetical protein